MWINKQLFDLIVADNKATSEEKTRVWNTCHLLQGEIDALRNQKAKDDITIDWMRHRINSLEKVNAQLLAKAAGIFVPTPEIVPTRPGTMSELPSFDSLPSFEDVGDDEAQRLGVAHEADGTVIYKK